MEVTSLHKVGRHFVSARAKRWLEVNRAWPIRFEEALLNTEGAADRIRDGIA
jgi:hypothetical protein